MKQVLDLEVSRLPDELPGLSEYSHVLMLLRFRGVPFARVEMPVIDGRITGRDLRQKVAESINHPVVELGVDELLAQREPSAIHRKLSVTIAICTRDRPEDLRICLQSLHKLPDDGQETLVVDNCPRTNATKAVVEADRKARYVCEPLPGANRARNRALSEARGDWVAFIDDDAKAEPGWLRGLARNFDEPLVLAVTGLTMPSELKTEAQIQFEALSGFCRGFRRRVFSQHNTPPGIAGAAGASVNLALLRRTVDLIGGFDDALDGGTVTLSGGDTEMLIRILSKGYRIIYDPRAVNWHRHRRTWPELRHTLHGYGVGLYAALTRSLVLDREWTVLPFGFRWLFGTLGCRVVRSILKRPGAHPLDLSWAEFYGAFLGPMAYWRSRRRLRQS